MLEFFKMASAKVQKSNPYVIGYTVLFNEDGSCKFENLREAFGVREYDEFNPNLTQGVCEALAKRNCKNCYSSGLQHFNNARNIRWSEACNCVKGKIEKMEEEMKRKVLGV